MIASGPLLSAGPESGARGVGAGPAADCACVILMTGCLEQEAGGGGGQGGGAGGRRGAHCSNWAWSHFDYS